MVTYEEFKIKNKMFPLFKFIPTVNVQNVFRRRKIFYNENLLCALRV